MKSILKKCAFANSATHPDGSHGLPGYCADLGCDGRFWDGMCKYAITVEDYIPEVLARAGLTHGQLSEDVAEQKYYEKKEVMS